jgi:hypothetical protein
MVERGDGLHFAVLGRTGIFNLFSHPLLSFIRSTTVVSSHIWSLFFLEPPKLIFDHYFFL